MGREYVLSMKMKVFNQSSRPLNIISRSFSTLNSRMNVLRKSMTKLNMRATNMMTGIGKAGQSIQQSFSNLPFMGKAAIAAIPTMVMSKTMQFNKSMAQVSTLLGKNFKDSVERTKVLKKEVRALAMDTGTSVNNLAGGLYQVVSAFGDSEESMKRLSIVNKAAIAGVASTEEALSLLSAVTKNYGDTSAEAMKQASDLAFKTVELGQTNFPELAMAMQTVATDAKTLSVSQKELFATMATLTGVTGNASMVATQLRSSLVSLAAPTSDMEKLYEKLGVESGKALIEQEGLQGALKLIMKEVEESGKPLQKFIGRVEGQKVALSLAGKQADVYEEKLGKIRKSTGATNNAFKLMQEGVNESGAEWEKFTTSLGIAATELGDTVVPVFSFFLNNVLQPMTSTLREMTQVGTTVKNLFAGFEGLTAEDIKGKSIEGIVARGIGFTGDKKDKERASKVLESTLNLMGAGALTKGMQEDIGLKKAVSEMKEIVREAANSKINIQVPEGANVSGSGKGMQKRMSISSGITREMGG